MAFTAKYQLNHPRGFRLLQNESVIERNLHSYFRLPPAPCPTLQAEREYIRYAMRVIEARDVAARQNRYTHHHHYHNKLTSSNNNNNTDNLKDYKNTTLSATAMQYE